jgi:hypothetical protein
MFHVTIFCAVLVLDPIDPHPHRGFSATSLDQGLRSSILSFCLEIGGVKAKPSKRYAIISIGIEHVEIHTFFKKNENNLKRKNER